MNSLKVSVERFFQKFMSPKLTLQVSPKLPLELPPKLHPRFSPKIVRNCFWNCPKLSTKVQLGKFVWGGPNMYVMNSLKVKNDIFVPEVVFIIVTKIVPNLSLKLTLKLVQNWFKIGPKNCSWNWPQNCPRNSSWNFLWKYNLVNLSQKLSQTNSLAKKCNNMKHDWIFSLQILT